MAVPKKFKYKKLKKNNLNLKKNLFIRIKFFEVTNYIFYKMKKYNFFF